MSKFVLAITGPSGSGKSTVGEKLAKELERCVNIDADHIKHMIVSGFHKDANNPAGWSFDQWELVGVSIGLLAANFIERGYDVIINGYLDPSAWNNVESHVTISYKYVLLPELATSIARDKERNPEYVMGSEPVAQHHSIFSHGSFYESFTKLDTTHQTVDETVKNIRGRIDPI